MEQLRLERGKGLLPREGSGHWKVGEHISRKIAAAEWGDGVVPRLAEYLARTDEPISAPLAHQS